MKQKGIPTAAIAVVVIVAVVVGAFLVLRGEPTLGILEGATNYPGPYPELGSVTYTDKNGQTITVDAYPGQVQVFFNPTTSQTDAQSAIQSNGGTILGAIPKTGYYLVQVTVGSEGSFISAIIANSQVRDAIPNVALALEDAVVINPDYLNPNVTKYVPLNITGPVVLDGGSHAIEVADITVAYGGKTPHIVNFESIWTSGPYGEEYVAADKMQAVLMAVAQGSAIYNPGKPLFVNMSFGSGMHDSELTGDTNGNGELGDWSDYANLTPPFQAQARFNFMLSLVGILRGIAGLPPDLYNNIFVTKSAGNCNMPMDPTLDLIESDPVLGKVLRERMLIAESIYESAQSNYSEKGNPNVVVMQNPEAAYGTSFGAPVANASLQLYPNAKIINDLIQQGGYTLAQAARLAPEISNLIASTLAANPGKSVDEVTLAFMDAYAKKGYVELPTLAEIQAEIPITPVDKGVGELPEGFPTNVPTGTYVITCQMCSPAGCSSMPPYTLTNTETSVFANTIVSALQIASAGVWVPGCSQALSYTPFNGSSFTATLTVTCCDEEVCVTTTAKITATKQ